MANNEIICTDGYRQLIVVISCVVLNNFPILMKNYVFVLHISKCKWFFLLLHCSGIWFNCRFSFAMDFWYAQAHWIYVSTTSLQKGWHQLESMVDTCLCYSVTVFLFATTIGISLARRISDMVLNLSLRFGRLGNCQSSSVSFSCWVWRQPSWIFVFVLKLINLAFADFSYIFQGSPVKHL